ncbi:MAG: type I polyketide synthase [Planctomycetota bacterium]
MKQSFKPIAIIGIGCRLPGDCDSASSYWNLLRNGVDAITETPADRWSLEKFYASGASKPGKTQSRWGGYVRDIDCFDPELFGISPREAACMDPQQRMLLEVAYRAAEDAGVPVGSLAGQSVSVHVGISSFDYAVAGLSFRDRGVIGPYSNTGGSSSIAANRISYCFDLRGESVAVDTACSSSLIATHLACRTLQDESNVMAFAGGVNALLLPDFYVAFSQLGVLSPDGRCKTFDASANGYVRSEGAGMVLLKRLDDAIRDGDPVYAVIRGSATNQDGRTEGMTVPSEDAQTALIRSALETAAMQPADISYVEAHGTGTPVGDPIEARAIAAGFGQDRSTQCHLGSVKTNIGHLEAGAGIASVIKVALALKHRQIPAHLHLANPNPKIDFRSSGLRVATETMDWNAEGMRAAGINGFGYGGANAHLILSEVETPVSGAPAAQTPLRVGILPITAHNDESLKETAEHWSDWLRETDASDESIFAAAATRRHHHDWRLAVAGNNRSQWLASLEQLSEQGEGAGTQIHPSVRRSHAKQAIPLAFVCSGQGPQWWGMGRGMMASSEVFRSTLTACDRAFSADVEWSVMEELSRDEATSRLNQTAIAQPSIFALQVALAAHWASLGVKPTVLVGHSVGEIAAAYLSGALDFEDACRVAVHRGRTMDLATSRGAMIAVGLSVDEARDRISGMEDRVSIGAINGPTSLTLSGCRDAIGELQRAIENDGIFCRSLKVEYAFHSPQMDPVRDELLRSLAGIQPRSTHTPLISTVTGEPILGIELDADYWWRNVRQSVRFADAMGVLADQGVELAIEIGPHPVLSFSIAECFQSQSKSITSLLSLNRKLSDDESMRDSFGRLFEWGFPLDWKLLSGTEGVVPTNVPTLAMSKQRLWSESFESSSTRTAESSHPLLGDVVVGPDPRWESRIDLRLQSTLADHRVRESCVLPAAAMIEIAAAAARQIGEQETVSLRDFQLQQPCLLQDPSARRIQTTYRADRRQLELACSGTEESDWNPLATCEVAGQTWVRFSDNEVLRQRRPLLTEDVSAERLYNHCEELGLRYGREFRGVTFAQRRVGEAIVSVELPEQLHDQYGVHPALLDSCFHGMIVADPDFDHTIRGLYLPQKIASIDCFGTIHHHATAHVTILRKDDYRMVADIDIFDASGEHRVAIRGFESVCISGSETHPTHDELLYRYVWSPAQKSESVNDPGKRHWLVFADQSGTAQRLAPRFSVDDTVTLVQHGQSFKRLPDQSFIIDPERRDDFERLMADVGDGVTDIVYLWGLDSPDNEELSQEVLEKSTHLTALAPTLLTQAWNLASNNKQQSNIARLAIVTRNAQAPDDLMLPLSAAQGPLIGFGRVVVSEIARLRTKLVDLSSDERAAIDIESLRTELIERLDTEDEVMYRDSIRWVRRFVSASDQPIHPESTVRSRYSLRRGESASIAQLRYESIPNVSLAPTEVEIEVVATGLNFSDVMKSLDLYPGLPDGPVLFGAECSGRITAVGQGVTDWKVDDEVVAIAPGAFASHVIVEEALVARKPGNLSHAEAASVPIAFLTAEHALNECARIRSGETVLIHAATGGVGIAATQLARLAGAEVFATAGTPEKRAFLHDAGVEQVMDSRSLDFAAESLEATGGEGVDAILNSLPGEAIRRGLSILRVGGRFLEIGKRDIYADASLGMLPLKNNLALFAIDLDQLIRQRPNQIGKSLRDLMARFENGELSALPVTTFEADETADAFRFVQQAKHIGKVAVDFTSTPAKVHAGEYEPLRFKPDRTYWVAGGLGGFGLRVARWLIERGAKHLVLGGRSGRVSDAARKTIEEWTAEGIAVNVVPVDLTSMQSVEQAVRRIEAGCPPLAGVLHSAMVLEDRLLEDLDRETLERVLGPKVIGGWNLHVATIDHDLDHFILFSSLSSVFGHAGQANYSAANAFLDSLAHYRRSIGMNAVAMNWGHVGEVGYLAERSELSQRLERQGVLSFTGEEAVRCLEHAIQTDAIQPSVLRMDWSTWRGLGITGEVSPRFAHLLKTRSSDTGRRLASAADIRQAHGEERKSMIADVLAGKVSSLLGIEPEKMDWDRPLLAMGLDSLMAVEMRNWIESYLEIDLPISELMRSEGLDQVCESIASIVGATDTVEEPQTDRLLEQLPGMSDDQVDQLLTQMLNDRGGATNG